MPYIAKDALEEQQATNEILQEVALYALWRGGFFEDFILQQPNSACDWGRYLKPLLTGLTEFGLQSEVRDKSKMDRNIREALLKNDFIGNQLNLRFNRSRSSSNRHAFRGGGRGGRVLAAREGPRAGRRELPTLGIVRPR